MSEDGGGGEIELEQTSWVYNRLAQELYVLITIGAYRAGELEMVRRPQHIYSVVRYLFLFLSGRLPCSTGTVWSFAFSNKQKKRPALVFGLDCNITQACSFSSTCRCHFLSPRQTALDRVCSSQHARRASRFKTDGDSKKKHKWANGNKIKAVKCFK